MHKAIVLLSGGLDSAVTAAIAVSKEGAQNVAFLHVNYGQRTEARELRSFNELSDHYGVEKRLVADISYLKEIGGSAQTDWWQEARSHGLGRGDDPQSCRA